MPKKKVLPNQKRDALLSELAQGALKALQNAEALYHEAAILYAHGAVSHALFLHQISMEECGKIEMLGGWATSLVLGFETNLPKLSRALARHKSKNYINAYMLPVTNEESDARKDKNWRAACEAFHKLQAQFHINSNTAKNSSLYVDYQNNKFIAPSETITEAMVFEIAKLNSEFLALIRPKVDMLSFWQHNPDEIQRMTDFYMTRVKQLISQYPNDPELAQTILMSEMLERAEATGYADLVRSTRD